MDLVRSIRFSRFSRYAFALSHFKPYLACHLLLVVDHKPSSRSEVVVHTFSVHLAQTLVFRGVGDEDDPEGKSRI